ncbi:spo11/DNA topoisomerase VI, subunit A protein [Artemisia annua]|uniref:Spo11/DNA topoisomerase VI, subunit A protein n=1 Tax=Artemisia annua TaxID=35608 RepID=A0A2U1PAX1_ARTAN|nr:spo11/DNA topoisomerase VI, subunit A protein [Artemisia annua]
MSGDNGKRQRTDSKTDPILKSDYEIVTILAKSKESNTKTPSLARLSVQPEIQALSTSNAKSLITKNILSIIHEHCIDFKDHDQMDAFFKDVGAMVACSINKVVETDEREGMVIGRLSFDYHEERIDCANIGIGGRAIPENIFTVSKYSSDQAKFILLVEKDDVFMSLAKSKFYNRIWCVIVKTGKGQPDVAVKLFVRKIQMELNLPVFALVDCDRYGLKVLRDYGLVIPELKWLGIRPSDLDKYNIPLQSRKMMTREDVEVGKDLLKENFVKENRGWVEELSLMVNKKHKLELKALKTFDCDYLTKVYLPLKLQEKDWM